jgi:two-component system chemotaxis response regulator CheY
MKPPRILIVDDDPDIREALILVLEASGFEAVAASDGKQALDALHEARPSLVLLDLMMPVMSGEEFMAQRSRDPALSTIPVVVLSGDAEGERRSAAVGASGYLKKPVALRDLIAAIELHAAG